MCLISQRGGGGMLINIITDMVNYLSWGSHIVQMICEDIKFSSCQVNIQIHSFVNQSDANQ